MNARRTRHPINGEDVRLLRPVLRRTHRASFEPTPRSLRGTAFALCPDEHQFALGLLDHGGQSGLRKHNLWLFRASQCAFAGDFVVVDVSAPRRKPRRRDHWARPAVGLPVWDAFVVELKRGTPLCLSGGGAGNQLRRARVAADEAVREAAARTMGAAKAREYADVIREVGARSVVPVVGSRRRVLEFFAKLRRIRRKQRQTRSWTEAVAAVAPQLVA